MNERVGSRRSSYAKIPGRLLMYRFSRDGVGRSFEGSTLLDAYRKAIPHMGKPDHFRFEYYCVPIPKEWRKI